MRKQWLCTSIAMGMAVLTACGGGASSTGSAVKQQTTAEQAAEQETKAEATENVDAETYIKQGDMAYDADDYDKASECYYHAAKLSVENSDESFWKSAAYDSMLECFDESKDQNQVYEYAKELYQLKPSESGCLKSFLWGASLLGTEEAKEEVREAVTGQIQEKWVMALLNARDALKQGNLEKAKSILFVPENLDEWNNEDAEQVYFGYPDGTDGTMSVVGLQYMFDGYCAMIGKMKNQKWEGECIAWDGYDDTYEGMYQRETTMLRQKEDYYYTGVWSNGLPEGKISYHGETVISKENNPEECHTTVEEEELVFSKGMAQGHTEKRVYEGWNHEDLELDSTIIHEYKDGLPQEFSVDTEEDGTMMVYEYTTFADGGDDYSELDCADYRIWNEE